MFWVGITIVGLSVAALNIWGTLRIWRSGVYERGQLVAQTAFIWILPGAAIAIVSMLSGDHPRHSGDDSTAANPQNPNADAMNGSVGHDSH